jgi:hypothetical protein
MESVSGGAAVGRFVARETNVTSDPSPEIAGSTQSRSGSLPSGLTLIRVACAVARSKTKVW